MKKFTLSMVVACAFCVSAAFAQMAPGSGSQGTTQSSPGMSNPRGQQPGMQQPDQTQTDQTGNTNSNHMEKGEKKLKGCIQSQGGQYVLESKKGKEIALTGQDVAAHVGHEVELKGMWENSSSASATSSGASSAKTFNVTDVKMISDTCSGKSGKNHNSSMGTGANGNNPSGTGSGTGTQPPQ